MKQLFISPIRQPASSSARKYSRVGQSLVEFALTLPLLLLLMVGILDLGRIYFAYMSIVNASREGARTAATYPTDSCSGTLSKIISRAQGEVDANIVQLSPSNISCAWPTKNQGDPVKVTVTYNFQLILTYIFGGGTIPLQASTEMVIFGQ